MELREERIRKLYNTLKLNRISYKTNSSKDKIRDDMIDFLKCELNRKKRKLSYLGMPSLRFYDIFQWKDYIDRVTSVEIENEIYQQQPNMVNQLNLDIYFKGLLGDIDRVILDGYDLNGDSLDPTFDIVFLDYWDGLKIGETNRIDIIEALVARQMFNGQSSWILSFNHSAEDENTDWYDDLYNKIILDEPSFKINPDCTSIDIVLLKKIIVIRWSLYRIIYRNNYNLLNYEVYIYKQKNNSYRFQHILELQVNEQSDKIFKADTQVSVWNENVPGRFNLINFNNLINRI